MSFSTADFIAMQARLQKNLRSSVKAVEGQREVGKGGIQEEIENHLKTLTFDIWWDRKRADRKTTSRPGVPDIVGVYRGKAFAMEIKRPGEKPTTEQIGELMWLNRAGAKTAVIFSKDEAVKFLQEL